MTEQEYILLVERLRNEFEPVSEIVEALPDINTLPEMTSVSLIENDVRTLYKAIKGKWYQITITEVV